MKKKGGKVKILRYFSILALVVVILALILNINFNATGKAIETASETTKTTAYIYGNGLVASYDSDGNEKFYINDHLGGTSVVLDENGNKISEESYYAFGEEKTSGDSRFTYTGKEKDDSGLYYYGARYYDADSGRFTQPDPISGSLGNPQSLNKYVYVLNNPNKYVDPSGMEETPLPEGDYPKNTPLHNVRSGEPGKKLTLVINSDPRLVISEIFRNIFRQNLLHFVENGREIGQVLREEASSGEPIVYLEIVTHGIPNKMDNVEPPNRFKSGVKDTEIPEGTSKYLSPGACVELSSCNIGHSDESYRIRLAKSLLGTNGGTMISYKGFVAVGGYVLPTEKETLVIRKPIFEAVTTRDYEGNTIHYYFQTGFKNTWNIPPYSSAVSMEKAAVVDAIPSTSEAYGSSTLDDK